MSDEESEVAASFYDLPLMLEAGAKLVLPVAYPKLIPTGLPVEIYPIKEVLEKFPTRFFSNSIAYMIAYALLYTKSVQGPGNLRPTVIEGYQTIYFYGIDMMTNSSYLQEKGGVEFWMGVALGMGVNLVNTRSSATGKTWNGRMYGYYGVKEEEALQEGLFAPWEVIRVSKASQPQDEWIKVGDEYKLIKAAEVRAPGGIANR